MSRMNPLHLGGFGVEILTSNPKPHAELKITVGRKSNSSPVRYLFLPRRIEYDSIILENATGNISLAALRWLSANGLSNVYTGPRIGFAASVSDGMYTVKSLRKAMSTRL
jgi:rhodanese-related sulfurtransferase